MLGSFGLSVALSKSAVLAGPALLFPIWGPWMRAGVRNVQVSTAYWTAVCTSGRHGCCISTDHSDVLLQQLWDLTPPSLQPLLTQLMQPTNMPLQRLPSASLTLASLACMRGCLRCGAPCCVCPPVLLQLYLRQFTCVGLWRSEVLSVRINTVPYAYRDPTGSMSDSVTVTVGDPWQGGAATELTFPYQAG